MWNHPNSRLYEKVAALRRNVDVLVDEGCGDLWAGIERALAAQRPMRVDVNHLLNQRETAILARASVLILGPRAADGASSVLLIRRLRSISPRIPIYVCTAPSADSYLHLRQFSIAGADDLMTLVVASDFRELADTVRARTMAPPPERELDVVTAGVPASEQRTLALHCLRNGHRRSLEGEVARRFQVTIQTVNHQLHTIGLPATGVLMRCGRQYHAFELERRGIRSREEIARRLGVASASALRMQRSRVRRTLAREGARGAVLLSLLDSGPDPTLSLG